uniref:PB1 domain-containing protein n=1 Tax=Maylandia zebra TaxID=106582 RepID=A0A3P9ASN3_9CICH
MAVSQKFLLRVHLTTDVVVKVSLTKRPESVEELITILREKLNPRLDFEFTLQYEDSDFDGQLTCLLDIQELPEKGTLKVVRSESDVSSCASSDTDILLHVPLAQRLKCWPDTFPVPTFSYEVEHLLEEGNRGFEMSGKHLKLTRAQKHNILETMASVMHTFKAYPSDGDVSLAAEALVTTHPCLKEPGSRNGSYGWKTSLKFKMGNYRTKLARSGCVEVSVNAGRRSVNNPEGEHPHSNIKRARRAEVNYLPNFPRGEDQISLEDMRVQIKNEVEKTEPNKVMIEKLMQTTFALRRHEIVQDNPMVKNFLEKWPALRFDSQVSICAEFRVTNINLRNQFYAELDRHTPRLMALYRQKAARTGKISEALRTILNHYDLQAPDINVKRTAVLRALPVYLRPSLTLQLPFSQWLPTALPRPVHFTSSSMAIVVEGDLVMRDIPRFADAFALLFGLIYALHLDYPRKLVHTFTFVQKIFMGLVDGKPLKPCLHALKNDLLLKE